MKRGQIRRMLFIALALVFLFVGISAAFALATHHTSCFVRDCGLCESLTKLQETLRVFEVSVGLLALLALLPFVVRAGQNQQNNANLVARKARLNN